MAGTSVFGGPVVGHTRINVRGMEKIMRKSRDQIASTSPGPIRDAFKQWGVRYRSAMQDRFDRLSKGGGEWPGLAQSTIERRRHGKGGRYKRGRRALAKAKTTGGGQISILRDTGQLFAVFNPVFASLPGQHEKQVPYGIVVGFGGPARKQSSDGSVGKATIAEVATYHHVGGGRLPMRRLLVDPSMDLQKDMAADMERAIGKIIGDSQVPPA